MFQRTASPRPPAQPTASSAPQEGRWVSGATPLRNAETEAPAFQYPAPLPMPPQRTASAASMGRRWIRWAIPLMAFLIGVGVGNSGAGTDPTATPQFQTLQGELRSTQREADQLSDEVEDAEAESRRESSDRQAKVEQRAAEVERHAAELEGQAATLAKRTAEVEARAQEVYGREKAVRAAEREVAAPAPSAPVEAGTESEPQAPTSTAYYDNCTAARNAGAAPVQVGDPGYGRHLDRDGDGVGCE